MGIGLFLVKKICNSLGYSIEFKGTRLADYNLPIYYQWKKQGESASLKTTSQAIIDEVVNMDISEKDWRVEDLEYDAAINQPTYRNEFCITSNKIDNNLIKQIKR